VPSKNFRAFYHDGANASPAERARIAFEVELIGKLTERINTLFKVLAPMGYKLTIVPNDGRV
jgi:hypothetical protein